jgi:polyribonucleotide nucleotidyltransferase
MPYSDSKEFRANIGTTEIVFKVGGLAQQAGGAVLASIGDSTVLTTATMSSNPREGLDFFPLSVDFEARLYAIGRIPGSWFRREGRPGEDAILTSRVTDRPLRPLFPDGMRNEVQIIITALAHDGENEMDMLSINAASAALMISDIPWDGPLGAVRIGMIDGALVVNPTIDMRKASTLDLRVAASRDAITMVECSAQEIPEDKMIEALELAHESVQAVIDLQLQMQQEVGKAKREIDFSSINASLHDEVAEKVSARVGDILRSTLHKDDRNEALDELNESVVAEYESIEDTAIDLKEVRKAISGNIKKQTRARILNEGVRPDGRDLTTVRPLSAEIDIVPRVHGCGLFQRGETQVMSLTTLGSPRDAQELDDLSFAEKKRYMHHYNFPPFSTGETWFLRGPKRREIGHGALAENALLPVLPTAEEFPYTLRVVSEVLSSNGSTSMGSVCASTLSLMAAGVPIHRPVSGIAMGLIKDGDQYAVLTDIQGMEDHIGDMDFKVAGTEVGITALQMDIKISGVTREIMGQALEQARVARMHIMEVMLAAIPEPRTELSPYAPRIEIIKIDPDKIGAIIGPGGKTIRALQEETNTRIEIEDDGSVFVTGQDGPGTQRVLEIIAGLTEEAEVGRIYTGKIARIESYGAFVNFLPGQDGMLHISQFSSDRIERIEDEFQIGDEIMVMVTGIEEGSGKVRLSRQAVLEGWSLEEAQSRDRPARSGGRGRSDRDSSNRDREQRDRHRRKYD